MAPMKNGGSQIAESDPLIRIGISSCLLGEKVRYNGKDAYDPLVTDTLAPYVEWVPVCPEMEIGMGTPREPIHLIHTNRGIRLMGIESDTDYTEQMKSYAKERVHLLEQFGIQGYILKTKSPSCGMEQVRVYDPGNQPIKTGPGMYTANLLKQIPLLPVEDEERFRDRAIRDNFIERVFAYYRVQQFLTGTPTPAGLVDFHTRHKLTILSHHQVRYREAGRLVSEAGSANLDVLLPEYTRHFMKTLEVPATRKNHTNVLNHAIGYFKDFLETDDKLEMVGVVDRYRKGLVPLVVPLTLIKHHLRQHPVEWLEKQVYLNPFPTEQKLRYLV